MSSGCGKGALADRMAERRPQHPEKAVELWAEDEARLGLQPIARRVWALRGRRPLAHGRTKYRWLDVSGFVHPASGRNLELLLPAANTDGMTLALEEFARGADPEGLQVLVVLVDNAGWHTAKRLAVPPNVVLHRLPPCTPELQPAEPLWPLVREVAAQKGFAELEQREPVLVERCRWLIDHPEVVRGVVGFHWAVTLNG
jgi:DDE superfamily endonuclease